MFCGSHSSRSRARLTVHPLPHLQRDRAHDPLFTFVDETVFARPTFKTFSKLLDNYVRGTGTSEHQTHAELREEQAFLDAILQTPVMEYALNYLSAKRLVRGKADFKKKLWDIWFKLYRRNTRNDTSGFEHVFVGEEDDGAIKGMHNWWVAAPRRPSVLPAGASERVAVWARLRACVGRTQCCSRIGASSYRGRLTACALCSAVPTLTHSLSHFAGCSCTWRKRQATWTTRGLCFRGGAATTGARRMTTS